MNGADQFHIGIVVDDVDAPLAELSAYTWTTSRRAVHDPGIHTELWVGGV